MSGEFLVGSLLSEKIRLISSGESLCCAVAFWGSGAKAELLDHRTGKSEPKIVCEISMGATSPLELEKMGAPDNHNLRYVEKLHAKVYISDQGVLIGSANASSGGIGFDGLPCGSLLEAGSFHHPGSPVWESVAKWFEGLYSEAKPVDGTALKRAQDTWMAHTGGKRTTISYRPESLLDLIQEAPERFGGIGFVFVKDSNKHTAVKDAKKKAIKLNNASVGKIADWKEGAMFTDWRPSDVNIWPRWFFEFWKPGRRLSVYARRVEHYVPEAGSVFTKVAPLDIQNKIGVDFSLPTKSEIASTDSDLAQKILDVHGNKLFATANDLIKGIESITRSTAKK